MIQRWSLFPFSSALQQGLSVLLLAVEKAYVTKAYQACCVLSAIAFALVSFSQVASATPLLASIHTYQERAGQTTFRSKQSLRDRSDRSWQVILFKRYQENNLQGLYLRLVGFPGIVLVDSQKPLKISTGASAQWQADPALDPQTPDLPENANQYDVAAAIADLRGDIPLQVDIPLRGGSIAQLVVPPFAVHEWRDLNGQIR
ncbi:MAG: DUF3122 domain-containing protein [Phormidesmis sp.]